MHAIYHSLDLPSLPVRCPSLWGKGDFFRYFKQSILDIYASDLVLSSCFSIDYIFHAQFPSRQQGIQDEGGGYINGNVTIFTDW